MMSKIILVIIILTHICCKQKVNFNENSEKIKDSVLLTQNVLKDESNNFESVDLDFNVFFEHFNKDSVFQISRVQFPILVKVLNDENFEIVEKQILSKSYKIVDLSFDENSEARKYNEYSQETIIKKNSAKILIRGIDNGIHCDFEFKKINGIWKLITWSDLST